MFFCISVHLRFSRLMNTVRVGGTLGDMSPHEGQVLTPRCQFIKFPKF